MTVLPAFISGISCCVIIITDGALQMCYKKASFKYFFVLKRDFFYFFTVFLLIFVCYFLRIHYVIVKYYQFEQDAEYLGNV